MGAGGTGSQAEKGEELTAVGTRGEGGLAQVQRQARRLLGDGAGRTGWLGWGRGGAVAKQGSGTVQSWAQTPLPQALCSQLCPEWVRWTCRRSHWLWPVEGGAGLVAGGRAALWCGEARPPGSRLLHSALRHHRGQQTLFSPCQAPKGAPLPINTGLSTGTKTLSASTQAPAPCRALD